jgi:protocatechuate 3,4-dioxygenase beta subunit
MTPDSRSLTRRGALAAGLAAALVPLAPRQAPLAATPACGKATPRSAEGPFFTPGSPQRTSLIEPGIPGEPIRAGGGVFDAQCRPVPGALLEFWQADGEGAYDNEGYRLRGHQVAGADGTWWLETVMPGLYPGRTRHLHVKVQAPGGPVLTTQLYFLGEAANERDGIFLPSLLMRGDRGAWVFDFVLATS